MITSEIPKKEESLFKSFAEMEKVVSALANVDALKVFYAAGQGIKSSTEAIRTLGLTQKKYYTHLRNLTEAGLIQKGEEAYQHTTLGKICYKLGEAFKNAISQRDRLDLADRLGKAKNISIEETEEIMRAILKEANIGLDSRLTDFLGPVRLADTWEKVVGDTIEYMEKAEESIYFATQYTDLRVAEAAVRAHQRGVKILCLYGEKDISSKFQIVMRTFFSKPGLLKNFIQFCTSLKGQIRSADMPYTFFVVDEKYAMVELAKPYTKAFSMAFFFHDEKLCKRLIETFEMLWNRGSEMETFLDKIAKS